jgi:hypothetical protein
MHRTIVVAAAAAGLVLVADGAVACDQYCGNPASNFSAYYYQSPGGLPRARSPSPSPDDANGRAASYRQSCGSGRVWKDDRCVRE